jgi:phage terminase large subunit-like protein
MNKRLRERLINFQQNAWNIEKGKVLPHVETSLKLPVPDQWVDFAKICKIRGDKGVQFFNPYEYQIRLSNLIEQCPLVVIGKTRQMGISEYVLNRSLWRAISIPGYLAVIFSKNGGDTMNFAKRIRRTIDSLDAYCEVLTNSLTDIEFKDKGRLLFRNSTPNGARGIDAAWDLIFDEAAFVPEIEEIYKAAIPTTTVIGDRARVIILSTPNGQSGWFYDKLASNNGDKDIIEMCDAIKSERIEPYQQWVDENVNGKVLLHWLDHPKFKLQKDTYLADIQKKRGLSKEAVEQEYNLSFTRAESIVFSSELVSAVTVGLWEKEADSNASYYMGIDTSLLGQDYFVAVVLKFYDDKYYLVDMYRKQKESNEYHLYKLSELIDKYDPVKIGIEVNGGGQIYYERLLAKHCDKTIVAIKTTAQSKPTMITGLMLAMEQQALILPKDKIVLEELFSFRNNDGFLSAIAGKHDDILMAISFALSITTFNKTGL